jgi:hypothetical protein
MREGKEEDSVFRLAEEAAEFTAELAVAGQKAVMGVLAAEVKALTTLVPPADEDAAAAEARRLAEEAEVEAGFDNMPI